MSKAPEKSPFDKAMRMAINAAEQFIGNTSPNPPVGAIALDKNGKVLCGAGHEKAGLPHAEVKTLELAAKLGLSKNIHTLVITLEPCNHQGRTPPCVDAILRAKIPQVVIGARDPNPKVQGGGVERLKKTGVKVIEHILADDCAHLLRQFAHHSKTGLPWLTVKTVHQADGTMIPPKGEKTFSSEKSLRLAHELRKRADAIWTGSGTILADNPLFTVRHVKDFPGKKRFLVISDRRQRISSDWKKSAEARGFKIFPSVDAENFTKTLAELSKNGVMEVLLEAGPTLSDAVLKSGVWNEHVVINVSNGTDDEVQTIIKD